MQTIAITTFNRRVELESCLACLALAHGLPAWTIRICDDASSEYDIAEVVAHSGLPATVSRNPRNLGCDYNTVDLLKSCLSSGADRVFVLDSDMIVMTDIFRFIDRVFDRTDGVLSVYNSVLHPVAGDIDNDLVRKNSIGGGATVWDAGVLCDFMTRLDDPRSWDWRMCDFAAESGVRLCVARHSRAQHVGIGGVNNVCFGELEYGIGFEPQHSRHTAAMAMALDVLMQDQLLYLHGPRRTKRKSRMQRWAGGIAKRLPGTGS